MQFYLAKVFIIVILCLYIWLFYTYVCLSLIKILNLLAFSFQKTLNWIIKLYCFHNILRIQIVCKKAK